MVVNYVYHQQETVIGGPKGVIRVTGPALSEE